LIGLITALGIDHPVEGKSATAIQQFRIEVEKKGNKNQYAGREMLHLRKEGGEWKIVSGL
jgi:ketosteroid isomerase-like protein